MNRTRWSWGTGLRALHAVLSGGVAAGCLVVVFSSSRVVAHAEEVRDIGGRLELMVDDFLIEQTSGKARRVLHHPVPQEVVLVHDQPWEGSGCGYHSIFRDGERYRMYYKAWQLSVGKGKLTQPHALFTCYAESRDGVNWRKPDLGLIQFNGSKQNNIVLASGAVGGVQADAGHVAVFKDSNPDAPPQARYKAIVRSSGPKGLLVFGSPDGLRWAPLNDKPVITDGAFDSQNLAFWDSARREYRAYFRFFNEGRRDIRTATSKDFLHWTKPVGLIYPGAAKEQLYTNQIKPYDRAPHLLIGFPTRYLERGWSASMRDLPELEHRRLRAGVSTRYGTAITEGLLMTSRDGQTFHRFSEAFLRPGIQRKGTWAYGDQYIAWHAVETKSAAQNAPNELSIYATEGYWTGTSDRLRRYTLRIDGFASLAAPMRGGEMLTRPLRFAGNRLELNFSTSAAGGMRVEIQDVAGHPLKGFTLADCPVMFGDELQRTVSWTQGSDVSQLSGKPVRLRFELRDADLYALRFRAAAKETSPTASVPEAKSGGSP